MRIIKSFSLLLMLVAATSLMTLGASAADLYVSPLGNDLNNGLTSGSAVKTVQHAIDIWASPGVIRVAGGTYVENPTLVSNITIYGGYSTSTWTRDFIRSQTILHPSAAAAPVFSPIVTITGATNWLVDGITIENGVANGIAGETNAPYRSTEANARGGGMLINNSVGTVNNCTFLNNLAYYGGGGVAMVGSTVTFTNSLFFNNRTFTGRSTLTLPGNTTGPATYTFNGGGALAVYGGTASLDNCVLTSNSVINDLMGLNDSPIRGGAILTFTTGTQLNLNRCTFSNNSTFHGYGGAISLNHQSGTSQSVSAVNCVFYGNHSWRGAVAQWELHGTFTMMNCTMLGNWVDFSGAAPQGILRLVNTNAQRTTWTVVNNCFVNNNTPDTPSGGIWPCEMVLTSGAGNTPKVYWNNSFYPDANIGAVSGAASTVAGLNSVVIAGYPTFQPYKRNIVGDTNIKCLSLGANSGFIRGVTPNQPAPGFTTLDSSANRAFVVRSADTGAVIGDPYTISDYDLSAGSVLIGASTNTMSVFPTMPAGVVIPATDKVGVSRASRVDIGAFQYPTDHSVLIGSLLAPKSLFSTDFLIMDSYPTTGTASVRRDWTKF